MSIFVPITGNSLSIYQVALFPLVHCETFVDLYRDCCVEVSKHHPLVCTICCHLFSPDCTFVPNTFTVISWYQIHSNWHFLSMSPISCGRGAFCYLTCFLKVKNDHCSKFFSLSNWKEQDLNPWPLWNRCDALPTNLWSHTLGARSIYNSPVRSEMMRSILYEIIHIWTAVVDESEDWSSQKIFQFKQFGKKKPEKKKQGFNGIQTCDLRDTAVMLYQLSYEATHLERGQVKPQSIPK